MVVDNASPDETPARLREIPGMRLLFNDQNVGFGAGANQGAHVAAAPVLCFLNSDVLVEPRWLPPLLETLERSESVGAAVPMILNLDGTIQEAGSVVDSDGWATALGAGLPAETLEYRFRRDVDFGSAACMVVRRDVFEALGGFDPAYGLGYFEDVDLCFRMRERGLRTVYEPRSRVRHVRWGSSSGDEARALMQRNRALFLDRWWSRLEQRPVLRALADAPYRTVAARDAETLDRILVVDDRVPHVDRGSGDPRMAAMLTELVSLWPSARVTLLALSASDVERYAPPLLDAGVEVVAEPPDLRRWLRSRMLHYSLAIVSRPYNLAAVDELLKSTQPQAPVVYDAEALFFRRIEREAATASSAERTRQLRAEAAVMRRMERRAAERADVILCVSPEERRILSVFAPGTPTFLVPAFVEAPRGVPGFAARKDVVFFGGFMGGPGSPNEDAVLYLASEVMPLVWSDLPDVKLRVIGANPTSAVEALRGERIEVVGFVEDPGAWLRRGRVHASPLRFGAGIKLKLLESVAAGLPFVTTPVGAEGLYLHGLSAHVVGNDARSLANLVTTLYTDEEAWTRVQTELLDIWRTRFDRRVFRSSLVQALAEVGVAPPRGHHPTVHDAA